MQYLAGPSFSLGMRFLGLSEAGLLDGFLGPKYLALVLHLSHVCPNGAKGHLPPSLD